MSLEKSYDLNEAASDEIRPQGSHFPSFLPIVSQASHVINCTALQHASNKYQRFSKKDPQMQQFSGQKSTNHSIRLGSQTTSTEPSPKKVSMHSDLLSQLQENFELYQELKGQCKGFTLKAIASNIKMSYRTLLSRYKEFKETRQLIPKGKNAPLVHNTFIETITYIAKALSIQPFKSGTKLTSFINQTYRTNYKRTRVLTSFLKLKFRDSLEQGWLGTDFEENRTVAKMMKIVLQRQWTTIYYAEELYQTCNGQPVKIMILCGSQGLQYKILTKEKVRKHIDQFQELLNIYLDGVDSHRSWCLLAGCQEIYSHELQESHAMRAFKTTAMEVILRLGGKMMSLPENCSPMNPAKKYTQLYHKSQQGKSSKKMNLQKMEAQLSFYKRSFFATFPMLMSYHRRNLEQILVQGP